MTLSLSQTAATSTCLGPWVLSTLEDWERELSPTAPLNRVLFRPASSSLDQQLRHLLTTTGSPRSQWSPPRPCRNPVKESNRWRGLRESESTDSELMFPWHQALSSRWVPELLPLWEFPNHPQQWNVVSIEHRVPGKQKIPKLRHFLSSVIQRIVPGQSHWIWWGWKEKGASGSWCQHITMSSLSWAP